MKVVTFGELRVRLQPFNYERFVQANSLEFSFGGGEANVAVSLANYGLDAAFVTKLPAHAIGQAAVNSLRRYGVDTSMITRGGDRVGIYYNEKGASQRGSVCIYDRANSAIQLAQPSDFDWDKIFEGVDWFHFTGITPALGENVVEICREACKAAKAHGVKISCDLNYRGKLWTREQARAAMTDLCQYVDVCISNEEDAKDVFGIEAEATDIYGGKLNAEGYKSVAKQLADKFHFEKVAITLRESHSAFDNGWSAMLYDVASNEYCFSKKYDLHIIDRVGGGDSFGGGLIYSLLTGKSTQEAVEFAVAASRAARYRILWSDRSGETVRFKTAGESGESLFTFCRSTHIPYYIKVQALAENGALLEESTPVQTPVGRVLQQQLEALSRGLVAVTANTGVFISWRLFKKMCIRDRDSTVPSGAKRVITVPGAVLTAISALPSPLKSYTINWV